MQFALFTGDGAADRALGCTLGSALCEVCVDHHLLCRCTVSHQFERDSAVGLAAASAHGWSRFHDLHHRPLDLGDSTNSKGLQLVSESFALLPCVFFVCLEGWGVVLWCRLPAHALAEAILSLIAIEHGFHEILQLQGFAPVLKFLGVKARRVSKDDFSRLPTPISRSTPPESRISIPRRPLRKYVLPAHTMTTSFRC